MKEFSYVVQDPLGLHARPAGLLVKKAKEFESSVTLKRGEQSADAKRIFSLMGLAIKTGETVSLVMEGPDEEEASTALETFVKENL